MDLPSRVPFPRWAPFAILGLAALYLIVRWDAIPASWPVHWGVDGAPNGWSRRTVVGVFGPLFAGAGIVALIEGFASIGPRSAVSELAAVRRASVHLLRSLTVAVASIDAFFAIDLPLGPALPPVARAAIPLAVLVAALVVGAARVGRAIGELRRSGQGANLQGYHPLYYANARDRRLWVPKLSGLGWTVNFANPWAWPVVLLLVGVPIAIAVLSRHR